MPVRAPEDAPPSHLMHAAAGRDVAAACNWQHTSRLGNCAVALASPPWTDLVITRRAEPERRWHCHVALRPSHSHSLRSAGVRLPYNRV